MKGKEVKKKRDGGKERTCGVFYQSIKEGDILCVRN